MTSPRFFLAALLLALLALPAHAEETFPQPPELQRDVDFWVSIFTRYTTDQGVLHDSRDLSIVYEHLDYRSDASRRERQRQVSERRKALQAVLKRLAGGKRDALSAEEQRILSLWPEGVDNRTLATAAKQIRHQQGLKDRFREGLMRAGRWRGYIEAEFASLGVPADLAALPHVESSYNPAARSHVGASGIWQFTRSTGRRFMRVDHVVDERNDPFAATRGAGRLLAYNYSITGNWPMAITAYNHGLSGVRRAMREFGDTAYVDILRNYRGRTFGFASRNFYVAFLAARHVDQNAARYFPGLTIEAPENLVEIELDAYIAVDALSAALSVAPRQLAAHNPALQATVWTGSKHVPKNYRLRVPGAALRAPAATLLDAIPASSRHSRQLPDMFHTVVRGDTLSQIASTYRTRVSTLVALNNLRSSNRIRVGQRIRLPAAGPAPVAVAAAAPSAPEPVAAPEPVTAPEPVAAPETVAAVVADAPAADPAVADADVSDVTAVETAEVDDTLPAASLSVAALAGDMRSTVQSALLSDPSDYSVAGDSSIEVHPLETLGHYADWLEIRTQRLRDINGLAFRTPVAVGTRIRLDLSSVDADAFEAKRIAYHRQQQDSFFRDHVISGITEHIIRPGESIWILSLRQYDVPVWLFRQYNPGLDLHRVRPGATVRFPVLSAVEPG